MKSRLLPSLVLFASACAAPAGTIIRANSPGSNGMGATNAAITASFGDNISLAAPGNAVFETYNGTNAVVGTPDIGLTWAALGGSGLNRWDFHAWTGATTANTGGGVLQIDGSQVNSNFSITFTPGPFSGVKLNSFNFVGDTNNSNTYQYRVDVVNLTTSAVDFTITTAPWITATAQNPTSNGTFANAPAVTLNFTGAAGVAYRLDMVRLTPPSGVSNGGAADMAIDNLDFDQLKFSKQLTWSGAVGSEWSIATLTAPKNWVLQSAPSTTADFVIGDELLFNDSAVTTTVNISNGDMSPGSMLFANNAKTYTITGINGIAGPTGLSLTSGGTLNVDTDNIFTGPTQISSGLLRVRNSLAFTGSTVSGTAGTGFIEFGSITSAFFGGLAGNSNLSLANNDAVPLPLELTVGENNANTSYGGVLSGAGSLMKSGTGTLALGLANTFAGGTTLIGGVLRMENPAALGSGDVLHSGGQVRFSLGNGTSSTVSNNFTLGFSGHQTFVVQGTLGAAPTTATTVTLTGKISGGTAGQIYRLVDSGTSLNHNNILELRNTNNDFSGTIEMDRGTLGINADSVLGNPDNDIRHFTANLGGALRFDAANITLNPNRTLDLVPSLNSRPINTQAFNARIEGQIIGNAFLVKQGTGTLTLAGATPFTGEARIDAGTLALESSATLGAVSAIALAATTTFDVSAIESTYSLGDTQTLRGVGEVNGAFTVQGTLSPGAAVNTIGTLTFGDGLGMNTAAALLQIDSSTGLSDRLIVTGNVTASNSSALTITDIAALPAALPPATKIAIIEYTGTFTGLVDINTDLAVADGATITIGGNSFVVNYDDTTDGVTTGKFLTLTVPGAPASGFSVWAAANAGGSGALASSDFDGDGVANGVEYFMGQTGSTFTANPPIVTTAGVRTITWPRDSNAAVSFAVQTTSNLSSWQTITPPDASIDTTNPSQVIFTLPAGAGPRFVRLMVTPTP